MVSPRLLPRSQRPGGGLSKRRPGFGTGSQPPTPASEQVNRLSEDFARALRHKHMGKSTASAPRQHPPSSEPWFYDFADPLGQPLGTLQFRAVPHDAAYLGSSEVFSMDWSF